MQFSFEIFPIKKKIIFNNFIFYKNNILLKPRFISITFELLNNNNNNINLINFFCKKNIKITPHISCVNIQFIKFKNIIINFYNNNIKNLIILRGDIIKKYKIITFFSYNLINFIKLNYKNFFKIYTGSYPEKHQNSYNYIINNKIEILKINCDINYNITQYFYNIDIYYYFINYFQKTHKIKKFNKNLFIPGFMPINSIKQIIKFSNFCKIDLNNWLIKKLNKFNLNNYKIKNFNIELICNNFFKLFRFKIKYAHFYTMNKFQFINLLIEKILNNINV